MIVPTTKSVQTSVLLYHTDLAYGYIFSSWRNMDQILR